MDCGLQRRTGELRRLHARVSNQRRHEPGCHLAAAWRPEAAVGFRRGEDYERSRGEQAPDTGVSPGLGDLRGDQTMAAISRREFMVNAAAAATLSGPLAARAAELAEVPLGPLGFPIGSQVWPTRSMLGNFPEYCRMMAEIGVS